MMAQSQMAHSGTDETFLCRDIILRCAWLLPVHSPPVHDGALVVAGGSVADFGAAGDMLNRYPSLDCHELPGVLMPPLVNGHCHLELSCYAHIPPPTPGEDFTAWIEALVAERTVRPKSQEEIARVVALELDDQYRQGIGLIGDVGNGYLPELHCRKPWQFPRVVRFLEFLAPNAPAAESVRKQLDALAPEIMATAHAPYSTIPEVLVAIQERSRRYGDPFSIHTAESLEESEFIAANRGPFQSFLAKRKSWDGRFDKTGLGVRGTVDYYKKLGILDSKTLLVHCVHISVNEIASIADNNAKVCLCPGSNAYLNVGCAPVPEMIANGLCPAIGTDSRASNELLDMWREMKILASTYPDLPAEKILEMATWGGAVALQQTETFGSLKKGSATPVLHLNGKAISRCNNSKELVKVLVSAGRPDAIGWIFMGNHGCKRFGEQVNEIG